MGIKFDKDPLAVEQTNYLNKIVNNYIVYDLHAWLRNTTNNFKFRNWLFGATRIVKNSDKEPRSGIFGNDTGRNIIIFGADNSSLSDTELMLYIAVHLIL